MLLCIKISVSFQLARITKERYLSVFDQGIVFCCIVFFSLLMVDDSVLSVPSIEDEEAMEKVIGAADERQNKKASKIAMQR